MKRIQKTKDLDYLVEVELETQGKQGVYSDLSAKSKLKAKSKEKTVLVNRQVPNGMLGDPTRLCKNQLEITEFGGWRT